MVVHARSASSLPSQANRHCCVANAPPFLCVGKHARQAGPPITVAGNSKPGHTPITAPCSAATHIQPGPAASTKGASTRWRARMDGVWRPPQARHRRMSARMSPCPSPPRAAAAVNSKLLECFAPLEPECCRRWLHATMSAVPQSHPSKHPRRPPHYPTSLFLSTW